MGGGGRWVAPMVSGVEPIGLQDPLGFDDSNLLFPLEWVNPKHSNKIIFAVLLAY